MLMFCELDIAIKVSNGQKHCIYQAIHKLDSPKCLFVYVNHSQLNNENKVMIFVYKERDCVSFKVDTRNQ